MPSSRRAFLTYSALGLMGAAIESRTADAQATPAQATALPPGAPPAFGTAPAVGPEVSVATFSEAEKLIQVEMTAADIATAASNWRMQIAPLYEMRVGPRKIVLESTLAPATQWNPSSVGAAHGGRSTNSFVRSADKKAPLPGKRRRHCICFRRSAFALDRGAPADLRAPDGNLFGTLGTLRSKAALRHHAHARTRSRAGAPG